MSEIKSKRYGTPRECLVCKEVFTPIKKNSKQRYCCFECKGIASRVPPKPKVTDFPIIKTCKVCGIEFTAIHFNQRYCNNECQKVGYKRGTRSHNKECPQCHKEFKARYNQTFCSIKCFGAAIVVVRDRNCTVCGKQFFAPSARPNKITCGRKCGAIHAGRQLLGQRRIGKMFECDYCGSEFWRSAATAKITNRHFCSKEHADRWWTKNKSKICKYGKTTKPEAIIYKLLKSRRFKFRKQYVILDRWCVDVYMPRHRLVIQVDGDYWHGHKSVVKIPSTAQLKTMARDKRQNLFLRRRGFRVVRLWEHNILKRIDQCERKIRRSLSR